MASAEQTQAVWLLRERRHVYQRGDQSQQRLLFWPITPGQKLGQFDVRELATRRGVRLINNEGTTVRRLAPKVPRVSVRASIEFPSIRH
jgi:hypothetical protein